MSGTPYLQISILSPEEIRKALASYGKNNAINLGDLDTKPIVELCLTNRSKALQQLCDMFMFTPDECSKSSFTPVNVVDKAMVADAIYQCGGDLVEAHNRLNGKVGTP